MIGRVATCLRLSPIVVVLALAACGGGDNETVTDTTPSEKTSLRVYFLRDGNVQPVGREVPRTPAVAMAAIGALANGPTKEEQDLGLASEFPDSAPADVSLDEGVLSVSGSFDRPALAQLVYTGTQFPTVKAIQVDGKQYTRADFEEETPAILVESPLPYERVTSPLHARGTANTFEATFEYDLIDPESRILKHNFVTATSGSGVRGTFDFTQPFTVDRSGLGKLVVYERSAEDGRRTNVVEIPLQLDK